MSFFSPVNQARWARFRHNRRGYWSLWLFLILFLCSLGAELLANDRPLLVQYRGQLYVPVLKNYTEQTFGGAFATAADYQDPGCSSSWRLTAGRYGRQYASARRQLILPARFPFHRRPQPATGSAPTPTAAMCWRGSSMGHASRCSSVCC